MKKLLHILITGALTLSLLFCFTACSSEDYSKLIKDLQDKIAGLENQIEELKNGNSDLNTIITSLQTKITNLEEKDTSSSAEIGTLKTKVAALEAADTEYKAQIEDLTAKIKSLTKTHADDKAALEAAIKANEDKIGELQANLDTLTESVVNASHIERTVIKPEDVGSSKPIVKSVEVEAALPTPNENPLNVKIDCMLGHNDYSFNYQLVTFKTTLLINGESFKNFDITITQAKSGDSRLAQTFNTKIPYDSSSSNVYTATWSEIVLYRFL